jgi:hypothetical protein
MNISNSIPTICGGVVGVLSVLEECISEREMLNTKKHI